MQNKVAPNIPNVQRFWTTYEKSIFQNVAFKMLKPFKIQPSNIDAI
jgi:hypothetical protein